MQKTFVQNEENTTFEKTTSVPKRNFDLKKLSDFEHTKKLLLNKENLTFLKIT